MSLLIGCMLEVRGSGKTYVINSSNNVFVLNLPLFSFHVMFLICKGFLSISTKNTIKFSSSYLVELTGTHIYRILL